ncbi:MAG: GNAT family N-acetyltransferase [Gudongella sp.]|nr:GNAT family N-acetyltransferase [Gudongella sp.]
MNSNDNIKVVKVNNKGLLNDFVELSYVLYKNDKAWVPPLKTDYKKYVVGEDNYLNQSGPNERIVAIKDNKVVGRLLVGINEHLNENKNIKEGYISLFECIDNKDVSNQMFEYVVKWLQDRGMKKIKGPLSLPGGDDNRGLLLDNFTDPTLIMNTYNKPYYPNLFTEYGFQKYEDVYAYKSTSDNKNIDRYKDIVPYAMERYKFNLKRIDLQNIANEMKDVKIIIEKAMPTEWLDFIPPNDEEMDLIAKQLIPYADPDLIYIARNEDNEPVGFNIALPNYNEVLSKMKGRLFPFGIFKFLYYKNKIKSIRFFVLFVVPEYQKKGVSSAIYWHIYKAAVEKGYKFVEGSTIWDYNTTMKLDIEKYGGEKYKTYRIYIKDI